MMRITYNLDGHVGCGHSAGNAEISGRRHPLSLRILRFNMLVSFPQQSSVISSQRKGITVAQKVQIILEDDLTGGPATSTVTFALDGTSYEIDLNEENAAKLRDSVSEWIRSARKVGRSTRGTVSRRTGSGRPRSTTTGAEREWLRENGYEVSSRGRISAELKEIYNAAH